MCNENFVEIVLVSDLKEKRLALIRRKLVCVQKYSHGVFLKTAALKISEIANRKAVLSLILLKI